MVAKKNQHQTDRSKPTRGRSTPKAGSARAEHKGRPRKSASRSQPNRGHKKSTTTKALEKAEEVLTDVLVGAAAGAVAGAAKAAAASLDDLGARAEEHVADKPEHKQDAASRNGGDAHEPESR